MREYYSFDEMLFAMEGPPAEEKYESQYDPLWKGILEPTFWHFMAFMFPDAEINFDADAKVTFLDKELQQLIPGSKAKKGIRHVDKLAKVSLPNGKHRYFLIHIEVQSARGEGDLERRVFQYWSRLYDKYNVPITTVAILADDNKSYRPHKYDVDFMGTVNRFAFNSYKILDQNEDALRANPNPFAVVILTVIMALKNRKANDEKLLAIKRDLFIQMRQRDMSEDCMRGVYNFLARYVHFENQENMFKFENQLKKEFGGDITMGIEEYLLADAQEKGIAIGKQEGISIGKQEGISIGKQVGKREEAIAIALEFKKMGLPINDIAKGTGLSIEDIEKL